MGYEAAIKDELLGLVEGFNFRFLKWMPPVLRGKAGEGVNNSAIVLQKASVKVAEAEE